jgi:hypothetical protein
VTGTYRRAGPAPLGTRSRLGRKELLDRGAHLGALWAFAVAQPLFHVLGRYPEYLAIRGSHGGDVVIFAVVVALVPPLLLLGAEWLGGLVAPSLGWGLHLGFVTLLVAAIALQLIPLAEPLPELALALALGAGAAAIYARWGPARSLLTVLSPAPLVFVVIFLFLSDASDIVFPGSADVQAASGAGGAPVVLVIFDEFPVHSLMAADGRIDERRYPNFARLARDATWYRNTASVDQDTPYAVPAILDARLPHRERLPVAADHPESIFSLLAGRYELHVREDATALCAPRLCARSAEGGFGARMRSLWGDLGLAYAHLVLPDDLESDLPSVTEGWARFEGAADSSAAVASTRRVPRETKRHRYRRIHANLARARPQRFEEFVANIDGGSQPRLHLIHSLLPHVPFQYLPSGRSYRTPPGEALPGLEGRPGYGIRFLVDQTYERHLLQLQATDRLLGRLLDRLHAVGIYNRAVVAVVADHGISFRLGHDRRLVRAANVQDIAPVPFFVKAPGQRRGRVSDKPLRTIDVVPTIADLIGVRIPWPVDGRSARAPTTRAQRHRRIVAKKFRHVYAVDTPSFERKKAAALARKLRLFGDDTYAFGPRSDLLGRRVAPLPVTAERAAVVHSERYRDVEPATGFVPARIVGSIAGGSPGGGRVVAAAVNGKIAATGLTFTLAGGDDEQFSLLVPEGALRRGRNRVEILLVSGDRMRSLGRAS